MCSPAPSALFVEFILDSTLFYNMSTHTTYNVQHTTYASDDKSAFNILLDSIQGVEKEVNTLFHQSYIYLMAKTKQL